MGSHACPAQVMEMGFPSVECAGCEIKVKKNRTVKEPQDTENIFRKWGQDGLADLRDRASTLKKAT